MTPPKYKMSPTCNVQLTGRAECRQQLVGHSVMELPAVESFVEWVQTTPFPGTKDLFDLFPLLNYLEIKYSKFYLRMWFKGALARICCQFLDAVVNFACYSHCQPRRNHFLKMHSIYINWLTLFIAEDYKTVDIFYKFTKSVPQGKRVLAAYSIRGTSK